jgi:peptide/nickel transport system substrate-binding protein
MTLTTTRRGLLAGAAAALTGLPFTPARAANVLRWASRPSDDDVLTWDQHATVTFLGSRVAWHVNEPLTRMGLGPRLVPSLATAWQLVGPTTWNFPLRQGVRFHDGSPLTPEDVVFSLERARGETSGWRNYLTTIDHVEAIDAGTIQITTTKPNPLLPVRLRFIGIMSRAWAEAHQVGAPSVAEEAQRGFAYEHANGTGPFQLAESRLPERWTLERNPNWWGLGQWPHNIDRIEWVRIDDHAQVAALREGRIDLLYKPPLEQAEEIERIPGVRLTMAPATAVWFISLDVGSPELRTSNVKGKNPFGDKRVRQAVYHAIDIERIVREVYKGHAIPRGMLVPPPVNGYFEELDQRLPYDPDRARSLLVEAGYPDGFSVRWSVSRTLPLDLAIQEMLGRIGIDLGIDFVSDAEYYRLMATGGLDLDIGPHNNGTLDAYLILREMYHSRGSQLNVSRYKNPEVDDLLDQIDTELTEGFRTA